MSKQSDNLGKHLIIGAGVGTIVGVIFSKLILGIVAGAAIGMIYGFISKD
jgi:uncharacterized membrane protein